MRLFEGCTGDPHNISRVARLFTVLIRHNEKKMFSGGTKIEGI